MRETVEQTEVEVGADVWSSFAQTCSQDVPFAFSIHPQNEAQLPPSHNSREPMDFELEQK